MRTQILSLLFTAIFSPNLIAQAWPEIYNPPAHIAIKEEKDILHRYTTPSFQILSTTALPQRLLTQFVRTAEAVPAVLKLLPLPLYAPSSRKKPEIEIALTEAGYLRAGGAKGTAGYYNARRGRVILQWEHFHASSHSGQLIPAADLDLLVHELTHLGTHRYLQVGPPWLSEGIAEYLAATHLKGGNFTFTKLDRTIREHLAKRSPPKAREIEVTNLKSLLGLSSHAWHGMTADADPFTTLQAYKSALLLTHYYFHGGKDRRAEMKIYLESLASITPRRREIPSLVPLAEAAKIQTTLTRYWAARGVRLSWK